MVTITCRCAHHAGDTRAVVMLVIAGSIKPRTWVPCLECTKIAFMIDEHRVEHATTFVSLALVEGGRR